MKMKIITLALFAVTLSSGAQAASLLSGNLNVDNAHTTFISTDNSVAGSQISSGTNWPTTDSFSGVSLTTGLDYFLHINATDAGGIASLLADFTLTGTDHVFANGSNFITSNTIDWLVSTSGWSSYAATTGNGTNGVSPWGNRTGVDSNATWIWSSDNENDDNVFFTLAINAVPPSAVPIPAAAFMFAPALLGFLGFRRRARA